MRAKNFVFLLISVGFSFVSAQKDSSENENPTNTSVPNEKQNKSMEKTGKPGFLRGQDPNEHFYSRFFDEVSGNPHLVYPGKQGQSIYLSDDTGIYDLKIQNIQQGKPSDFQTALGVISAHILNQKKNPEYIPYPPNGDPYNYPAYRGHPRATEPPVVRAYERASNANYDAQPRDFEQQNPRGLFASTNYRPVFPNQFENSELYNNPEFFNDGLFYSEVRRSDPVFEPRWHNRGEVYRRPIK